MQPVLNVEDVRTLEESLTRAGVSISELMRRAGAAAANEVLAMGEVGHATVFSGFGNNGGDGWVAAEELLRKGVRVSVITPVPADEIGSDLARVVAQGALSVGVEALVAPPRSDVEELLAQTDVVVDCMFGTGFHGTARTPFDIWIDCVNASGARVLAVDVPSGLSAQTGHIEGPCVVADETITMLTLKPGLLSDKGRDVCGAIVVAPLAEQTDELAVQADPVAWRAEPGDYQAVIAPPTTAVDKFTRGSVLVVGGSTRFVGAPVMAALAAARTGAGYVTLAVPEPIVPIVQSHTLEIPVVSLPAEQDGAFSTRAADVVAKLAEHRSATLVGPGMRVSSGTVAVVSALLNSESKLVVDADALNCIARLTSGQLEEFPELLRRRAPLVLTPHRSELGRLVGLADTPPDSLTSMLDAARRIVWADGGSELAILAKGNASVCVGVEAAVLPKPGPASLATAGSGDVLGGVMATLLARGDVGGPDLPLLAALACEIHGHAALMATDQHGSRGVMAGDVIGMLGLAVDAIEHRALTAGLEYE
ncbi:MAG: NAD(P)H-hydrate epimerase [Acidobacteriota bacterium]|nr:NAD(P)H-hydrate epimerase [Acidobacteriota bacterium]